MKKLFIVLIALICVFSLSACSLDFSEKLAEISDNIMSQVVGMAGGLLKEDTSLDTSNNYESELIKDTGTGSDSSSDGPDEPLPEPEPTPTPLPYERSDLPLNKYVGFNANRQTYRERSFYGFGRLTRTTEDYLTSSHEYSFYAINSLDASVHLNFDLSAVGTEESHLYTSVELASMVREFAKKYCSPHDGIYKIRRFELGSSPDKAISAENYASLLNLCYDGNLNSEEALEYGLIGVNPEVKMIAGQMSTVDVDYVKALMTALGGLRNDGFLPIAGWSFSYAKAGAPEGYLTDTALNELIQYRDTNYSNLEIILTELQWDTKNTESPYYVAPSADYTSEELQCAYILRAFMILNQMGVDRSSLISFRDTETDGYGVYDIDVNEKLSFSGISAFHQMSLDMYLVEAIRNGEDGVYVYKYESENGDIMYAMWATEEGKTYELSKEGATEDVATYDKSAGTYEIERTTRDYLNLSFELTEMPTFVRYYSEGSNPDSEKKEQ